MANFFMGATIMWVVLSIFVLLGEHFDWLYTDWFLWCCAFPAAVASWLALQLYQCFVLPWRNVWFPSDQATFDRVAQASKGWQRRLAPRFYLCWDPAAQYWYHRVFFVRIKK